MANSSDRNPWQVNLKRLIDILNQFTYANKDVAIRELISNAADSITQRIQEDVSFTGPRIDVRVESDRLIIEDNGAGMIEADLHGIFSTVAASTKPELRQQLEGLNPSQPIIGALGIGRLAAFLIADTLIVETRSWKPGSEGCRWVGTPESYRVEKCPREDSGTRVILADIKEPKFLKLELLEKVILDHSRNIGYLIYLASAGQPAKPVNESRAPWYNCDGPESLPDYAEQLTAYLHELSKDDRFADAAKPVTVIHLWETGPVTVKGVLYVPRDPHFSLKHGGTADVYCRGVFICHDYELVPPQVGFVKGIVESPDFTPTVNRQGLVRDRQFALVQRIICQAVLRHLVQLGRGDDDRDRARLTYILAAHREAIIHGAIDADEEFFKAIADFVLFRCNLPKESPTTLRSYRRRTGTEVIKFVTRQVGEGHLEQLVKRNVGEVLVIDDDVEKRFIERYALDHGLQAQAVSSLASIVLEGLKEVPDPPNAGWRNIITYYEKDLDHAELKITVKLAEFERDDTAAIVVPDPQQEGKSFLSALAEEASSREGDPAKRRSTQSKLQQLGGRREVWLYLNVRNKALQRLSLMLKDHRIDSRQQDVVLHEIFHNALVFADIPLPVDHLCEVHDRAMKELCINMDEVAKFDERGDTIPDAAPHVLRKDVEYVLCFLALPFRTKYAPLLEAVRLVLETPPYHWRVITAADWTQGPTITENVIRLICKSDCYLAEVSEHNENVMIELGMMLGMMQMFPQRPLGLLHCEGGKPLPTDVRAHIALNYSQCDDQARAKLLAEELDREIRRDPRFRELRGARKYLSPTLLKSHDFGEPVIAKITAKYDTIEAFCGDEVAALMKATGVGEEHVVAVRNVLKREVVNQ